MKLLAIIIRDNCMASCSISKTSLIFKSKLVHFMFTFIKPSYAASTYSYVTNVFRIQPVYYRMCLYVLVSVTRRLSYVTRMYSYQLLECTRMLLVCYSYVLVCYSFVLYVSRMYSYVIRMLLIRTSYLLVCYLHVLVWCSKLRSRIWSFFVAVLQKTAKKCNKNHKARYCSAY